MDGLHPYGYLIAMKLAFCPNKPASFFLLEMDKIVQRILRENFHQYQFRKNKEIVFQTILDMNNMLEGKGIDFQLVILPIFPPDGSFAKYPLAAMHSEIGTYLDSNSISYLDLYNAFSASGEQPEYFGLDIWHPNERGHALIATELLLTIPPAKIAPN